jgi:hypothetical protein
MVLDGEGSEKAVVAWLGEEQRSHERENNA